MKVFKDSGNLKQIIKSILMSQIRQALNFKVDRVIAKRKATTLAWG